MKKTEKKFSEFINFCNNLNIKNDDILCSFAFEVNNINLLNILDNFTSEYYFYWERPSEDLTIIAFNKLIDIDEDYLRAIKKNCINNFQNFELNNIPIYFGASKFATNKEKKLWKNFEEKNWFIPEIIFHKKEGKLFCVINSLLSNINSFKKSFSTLTNSIEVFSNKKLNANKKISIISKTIEKNEKEIWQKNICSIKKDIEKGKLNKAVISRVLTYTLSEQPIISSIMKEWKSKYSDCYLFAFKSKEEIFIGASPERLLKVSDGLLKTDSLAGSTKRSPNIETDNSLAKDLLHSKKNLFEHNTVTNFIVKTIKNFSNQIQYSNTPIIKKLNNIQHLWTPITAKLTSEISLLEIAHKLHPTPAICGAPKEASLQKIIELENYDRGLFTGIIGWGNLLNEGEIAVGIRSALIKGNRLHAFAGCGIVEDSDWKSEYEETNFKLKTILDLFNDET